MKMIKRSPCVDDSFCFFLVPLSFKCWLSKTWPYDNDLIGVDLSLFSVDETIEFAWFMIIDFGVDAFFGIDPGFIIDAGVDLEVELGESCEANIGFDVKLGFEALAVTAGVCDFLGGRGAGFCDKDSINLDNCAPKFSILSSRRLKVSCR